MVASPCKTTRRTFSVNIECALVSAKLQPNPGRSRPHLLPLMIQNLHDAQIIDFDMIIQGIWTCYGQRNQLMFFSCLFLHLSLLNDLIRIWITEIMKRTSIDESVAILLQEQRISSISWQQSDSSNFQDRWRDGRQTAPLLERLRA
jgi:hypothetical protein